ncbi:hypothetical protein H0H92_011398 [Tricholoma furcatifolium]|nr:hypothetical protein H0H92_011398 [Tricholoma furcatifolium]
MDDLSVSLLALIPLVNLHDLATHELALRIGGSKAGLVNASLSNMVSIVVAITALRKCHLAFVQSTLMGAMLSKLFLGLCFLAGGTRFSEQGFDPTATQMQSTLLGISVAALFLPAAYHFSLSGSVTDIPDLQKKNILSMSHGVSIVLLFIYGAYLVFQLWSHSYLYTDIHNRQSVAFSSVAKDLSKPRIATPQKNPEIFEIGDRSESPSPVDDDSRSVDDLLAHPVHRPVYLSPIATHLSSSQLTLAPSESPSNSQVSLLGSNSERGEPTVKLVPRHGGYPMTRNVSTRSAFSTASTVTFQGSQMGNEKLESPIDTQGYEGGDIDAAHEPRVGILLVVFVLVIVTVTASVTADWLVDSMDGVSSKIDREWVGLILLPAVTSLAECMTAVNVSVKDELTFSIGVAVGSAIQTALFVIPFIVMLAWAMGKPLSLLMDPFQSLVLYISVQTVQYVVVDGKSNWLEGKILVSCGHILLRAKC